MKPQIFLHLCFASLANSFCWKPGSNPFYGSPKVTRLSSDRVRLDWSNSFRHNDPDCDQVDFLIKSNPRHAPSNYKLSNFTPKGQLTASLVISDGEDFVFQVIAREDKGQQYGIDYKYSQMITSYASSTENNQFLPDDYDIETTTATTTTEKPVLRKFKTPQTRSLPSRYIDYSSYDDNEILEDSEEGETLSNPWFIYECLPFLKNIGNGKSDSKFFDILIGFVKHVNHQPLKTIESFIATKGDSCNNPIQMAKKSKKGYLVECEGNVGIKKCCESPWGCHSNPSTGICYDSYSSCDGHCIPSSWISDGWPDCMDGGDEADFITKPDGKTLPYYLQCLQCSGAILTAGFICSQQELTLTLDCVQNTLGKGQCNVCIDEFLKLH